MVRKRYTVAPAIKKMRKMLKSGVPYPTKLGDATVDWVDWYKHGGRKVWLRTVRNIRGRK